MRYKTLPVGDLEKVLQQIEDKYKGQKRHFINALMSRIICAYFLGKEKVEEIFSSYHLQDQENRNKINELVLSVAHFLYVMNGCAGFDNLIQNLINKDIKSGLWELSVAYQYYKRGYQVEFNEPRGRLTDDFDLRITADCKDIYCVECKRRENIEKSALKTVKNALSKARKQLPAKGNGIIHISVPKSLYETEQNWSSMDRLIKGFLNSTTRVRAVVIDHETFVNLAGGRYESWWSTESFINIHYPPTLSLEVELRVLVPSFYQNLTCY